MLILPAIDLIEGRCVRLVQGDYEKQTTYSDDPVEVAARFESQGATWLHLVDLDGAKAGSPVNLEVAKRIVAETSLKVEFGGGIKTEASLHQVLEAGVTRAILGSALVKDKSFTKSALKLGDRVVCGLDARDRKIAITGWLETSEDDVIEFGRWLEGEGAVRFILTDIARDGMLNGPNLVLLRDFLGAVSVPVIQSGGISGPHDILDLASLDLPQPEGVIVGKALYEGRLTVAEAIKIADGATLPAARSSTYTI